MKDNDSDQAESTQYQPTVKLRRFVEALLSDEVMGNKRGAERVSGVRRGAFFYNLKKSADFKAWFKQQCADVFTTHLPSTVFSIQRAAARGDDTRAALALLEMAGLYRPKELDDPGVNVNVNVYPQKTIVFQDVKPNGDEQPTDSKDVYAGESAKSNCDRLPVQGS